MERRLSRLLRLYWGYILLAAIVAGIVAGISWYVVLAVLSVIDLGYFLLLAPTFCGVSVRSDNPDGCRNNSRGLLRSCHLRQHRWQKLKGLASRGALSQVTSCASSLTAAVGGVVATAGFVESAALVVRHKL
jgi:hypothetical protein